jgi:hypothetical protein
MSRGYTFTCHTCQIVYEIGYGSYGHYCLQPDSYAPETLAEYKRRLSSLPESERRMAIAEHYRMVMVMHALHEWDALDSEFSEIEDDYDERRSGYFNYSFWDAWRDRESKALEAVRKLHKENPQLLVSELTQKANDIVDADVMSDDWAQRIVDSMKPKKPLPKHLQRTLKNWKVRMAHRDE